MHPLTVLGIAFALAMDAFATAIACSVTLRPLTRRQVFRLSFHFGLFQALMPLVGWLAGLSVERYIRAWDHWLAFGLLLFVGGKALLAALRPATAEVSRADPTRGLSLFVLSLATSIDALAVGLSLAALRVDIFVPALVIGGVAGLLTWLGMAIGSRLGGRFGRRMEALGGLVLIAIGVKVLVEHLSG